MAKQNNPGNKTSQYDKIIKENLEVTMPVIIRDLLGLEIVQSEELPDDIQHTKERKPDALKKVTDTNGHTYVLHLEFQIADEKEMVYRMVEYCAMLMRKYKLPVKQYVIFLKDTEPAMTTFIATENLKFNYNLIRIAGVSYKLFLKADSPEVKMLGILGNFEKDDSYEAVKAIINEVQAFAKSDFAESRYFEQLRIFVQLRGNIEQQFEKVMESVTKFFKEENDFLYRKGEVRGIEKGIEKGEYNKAMKVAREFKKMGISTEDIAKGTGLSIEEIEKL